MSQPTSKSEISESAPRQPVDVVVIGAGFGGMYAVHRLRSQGLSVVGFEAGGDVGGVWYWNRYPGARCDVFSIDYSYSFSDEIQREWNWSEEYSAQPEILAYANFVADKIGVRQFFNFNTRVRSAVFNEAKNTWTIRADSGLEVETRFCIMATGPLSIPKEIDIEGAETFRGAIYRAAKWPHAKIDFTGQRVGVVGTGSSGIQIASTVAHEAAELYVFQRTPSFTFPMRNKALTDAYRQQVKDHYQSIRQNIRNNFTGGTRPITTRPLFSVNEDERQELLEDAWHRGGRVLMGLFSDALTDPEANEIIAEFVRGKIGQIVKDPKVAERLKPRGYPIFSRRPCLDINYYDIYNQPNVHLIDCLTDPIQSMNEQGVKTLDREIGLDSIIFATGYDGLTGAMLSIDIRGRGGQTLADKWKDGARSYLGLAVEGFPNLFMICGANGPSALANIVILNEENADWIGDGINYMREHGYCTMEADVDAEDNWVSTVAALAEKSLIPKANTWYTGSNIQGKPHVFPIYTGGLNRYRDVCSDVSKNSYRGFTLR